MQKAEALLVEEQRFVRFMQCFLSEYRFNRIHHKTDATDLLKAISNSHRLMVLFELTKTEIRATELKSVVGVSASNLSKHLKILLGCGLIKSRRDSQSIYYSIAETNNGKEPDCFMKLLKQY